VQAFYSRDACTLLGSHRSSNSTGMTTINHKLVRNFQRIPDTTFTDHFMQGLENTALSKVKTES